MPQFKPRLIRDAQPALDADGIKLYTVSFDGEPVRETLYRERLQAVKTAHSLNWEQTAAFAIFHQGATAAYLVLCWWGNDNEMLSSVSVLVDEVWVVDPAQYSFCLWDLEILWAERNIYIRTMYSGPAELAAYRQQRFEQRAEDKALAQPASR